MSDKTYTEAQLQHLQSAAEQDPNAKRELVMFYSQSNASPEVLNEARRMMNWLLFADPENPDLLYLSGDIHFRLGGDIMMSIGYSELGQAALYGHPHALQKLNEHMANAPESFRHQLETGNRPN